MSVRTPTREDRYGAVFRAHYADVLAYIEWGFTLIFAANRDQIRDPNRIYPGQVFAVPAPAESSRSR